MSEWVPFNNGLPNVIVRELEIQKSSGTISAATYGRGVWQSPVNTITTTTNDVENPTFRLFPNPAKNKLTIVTHQGNLSIKIYTLTGKKILVASEKEINISDISSGCYIVEVNIGGDIKREKLIIK